MNKKMIEKSDLKPSTRWRFDKPKLKHLRPVTIESVDGASVRYRYDGEKSSTSLDFRSFVECDLVPVAEPEPPEPTRADLRERAFRLYRGPFRYEQGYVWDADNEMVADDRVEGAIPVGRVRGWGRVSYLPEPKELQDAVGDLIAEALTAHWENHRSSTKAGK
jgi:hypothetical protein